ncbi:hypothetical protein VUJ46_20590 [Chryseobacterium sp. MYb264]|uniref:hypothetical protein n=1 Tax=Chryseobacterium sp. MYb264 TaxID=2745153 RepID=UPI002E13B1A1|nr:hypothetical protein VUJ46_20590 [Chryseobacterium sp. MYb264]
MIFCEFNLGDVQNFYDLNSNRNVIRFTGNSAFENVEEARDFLLNYKDYDENGFGRWAVI